MVLPARLLNFNIMVREMTISTELRNLHFFFEIKDM